MRGEVPKPYSVPEGYVPPTMMEQWRYAQRRSSDFRLLSFLVPLNRECMVHSWHLGPFRAPLRQPGWARKVTDVCLVQASLPEVWLWAGLHRGARHLCSIYHQQGKALHLKQSCNPLSSAESAQEHLS